MSDDNNNLHTYDDEASELEREFKTVSVDNDTEVDGENSSLFETEKADTYFENMEEDISAEIEAEIEAENKLFEKRKKDREKARKQEQKTFRDVREKHERDVEEENLRRARAEEESAKNNGNTVAYKDDPVSNNSYSYDSDNTNYEFSSFEQTTQNNYETSDYQPSQNDDCFAAPRIQKEPENSNYSIYENKEVSGGDAYSVTSASVIYNNATEIHEVDYNKLRENYELMKQTFKAYGKDVPDNVIIDYRMAMDAFYVVQRKIDQGELTVVSAPVEDVRSTFEPTESANPVFANYPDSFVDSSYQDDYSYNQTNFNAHVSTDIKNVSVISEADYTVLRENYENSKNAFQASSDNVSESVMLQYKEDSERFFAAQRKIDQGELTVLPTPTYEPSPSESYDGRHRGTPFNTVTNEQSPLSSYNSYYPKTPRSNLLEPNNSSFGSHNTDNRDSFSPVSRRSNSFQSEEVPTSNRSGFNPFEQNMARYANAVYSQTSRSATPTASSSSAVYNFAVNNISRERYEALKQKYSDLNIEIASYAGKDVPRGTMHKAEQISRLFSAINAKVENGQLNVVDTPPSVDKGVREVRRGGSTGSTFTSLPHEFVINNITRARYEALKQKCSDLNNEIASYAGKDVPKEAMRKAEQTSRLFSAINTKIENGQINVVDTPLTVDKRVREVRRGGSAGSIAKPSAFGTQAFYDRSKDNFSPRGKRVGDSHIKPVGTPFQGSPLGKYDKLKIKHALEVGSPFEMASRRSLRAVSGAVIAVAQSEQSGTARMMVAGQERARDAINAAKAIKDLPRQVKVAYNAVQNTATSVRNIGRFVEGKYLAAHKERKPLTVKQIKKQLNDNPFSSLEKGKIKEKFGSNSSLSNSQLKRKITFNTANNKNLKNEIKALQNKGSSLSAAERKKLKDLLAQKKEADAKLRNIHGAKKVREEAMKRNRASDRTSKKDVIKTIKKNSKKGVRLSKKDKAVLSHLIDKKKLLEQREKLFKSRQARKQLVFSLGGVLGKAMRESEESTVQGILGASRILQNRYVRTVLKVATKTALLPVVGVKKVAGTGLRKLDNKFGVSASVKKTVKKLEEKAVRKTLNTKVYKELHGGIYNRVKKTINSKTPGKIKTGINKGKNALNQINSNRKKVLDKFNNLKSKLKDSKLGRVASKLGSGFGKISDALKVFKKAFVKVGIYCGGFVILIALIGCFITSIGGVASSLFLGDDSADGRIDLTSYIEILNQEEQAFLTNIDTIASDPGNKYENITVNYQTGTLVNNFKEILSMTAVYFNQDFKDKTAVKSYIQQLYSDSHYYTQVESEPYACSGCVERKYKCTDNLDELATNKRKELHNDYAERGGCKLDKNKTGYYDKPPADCRVYDDKSHYKVLRSWSTLEYVANELTLHWDSDYVCSNGYRGAWVYNSNGTNFRLTGADDFNNKTEGPSLTITWYNGKYCQLEYVERYYCYYYTCPGNHTEIVCPGDHIDLDINVMVLGFDDIFYADSSVTSSISGIDTSTGNVVRGDKIGMFTITHYCTERYPHICNAGPPYKTASGTDVTPGRTIAVDKSVIPLGTHVIINGHEYIAEDTGGAIKGNRIDIAVATHSQALSLGKKTYMVYSAKALGSDENQTTRNINIPYLNYSKEFANENFSESEVLKSYGTAKDPEVTWLNNRFEYDNPNTFATKLQNFDKKHENKAFTNAELNTFEYVKMTRKKLLKLAKERTGKDYSEKSTYYIITSVLIPYDKKHPDEYLVDPDSGKAEAYYFKGWTAENVEWAKNIHANMNEMNEEAYVGLDKINQFSGENVSYEGVIFEQGETKVVYYSQYDVRWKNLPYSNSTIGAAGCGPTSMAMIVSSLTDKTVDPIQMCNWAASKGYYVNGAGTAWSFVPGAAANWGLSCRDMGKGNAQAVVSALSQGKLVIMSTGSGSYYQGDGHFLVLRGVDEYGKILVADPASKVKSETSWSLQQITSGLKNWWIIG